MLLKIHLLEIFIQVAERIVMNYFCLAEYESMTVNLPVFFLSLVCAAEFTVTFILVPCFQVALPYFHF